MSPQASYRISFSKAGVHYLWLRTAAASGSDDSLHAGLNGTVQGGATNLNAARSVGWSNTLMGGAVAKIVVPSAGFHTVNLWMREDGVIVDKVLLTTSASFAPSGTGPASSPRDDEEPPPPPPPTGDGAYQQGADGVVSMEAEDNDGVLARGGKTWAQLAGAAYTGGKALQAGPNTGTQLGSNTAATQSPQVDFKINFANAGVHYLWLRTASASSGDDSLHAGLNGVAQGGAINLNASRSVGWSNTMMGGAIAKITVPSAGVHTLNLWMREDGVIVDKIVLATSASFVPSGNGPVVSPRDGEIDPDPDPDPPPPTGEQLLEAESATLSGVAVSQSHTGHTGGGYADFSDATGAYIEWAFDAGAAGTRTLTFRYANGASSDRPLELWVNGQVHTPRLSFVSTGGWSSWRTVSVTVQVVAGNNRVRLTSIGSNGGNFDSLTVE
jgi:hypothetical protein